MTTPEPTPTEIAPAPELQAHQRLQRALLAKGAHYILTSDTPGGWRDGPVCLLLPSEGGEGPGRVWICLPRDVRGLRSVEINLPKEDLEHGVVAAACSKFPQAKALKELETRLGVAVIGYTEKGRVRGGELARAAKSVADVKALLDTPEDQLAAQDPEQAHGALLFHAEVAGFEGTLQKLVPTAWVTWAIFGLCMVVWLVQVLRGVSPTSPSIEHLRDWGGNFGPLSSAGEPWRTVTAGFLHSGVAHLGMNMWALWDLGRFSERLFGHAAVLVIFLCSVIAGCLGSMVWHPLATGVGASAGIFGLAGAVLGFMLVRRDTIPRSVWVRHGKIMGIYVLLMLAITGVASLGLPIDNAAHVAGLVAGFVSGCCLARPIPPTTGSHLRFLWVPVLAAALALAGTASANAPGVAKTRVLHSFTALVPSYEKLVDEIDAHVLRGGTDPSKGSDLAQRLDLLSTRVADLGRREPAAAATVGALQRAIQPLQELVRKTPAISRTDADGLVERFQKAQEQFVTELKELRAAGG